MDDEEASYDDGDYYYHGEDGRSELDAVTVTSVDSDEYYDYAEYDAIVNNRLRRQGSGSEVVKSPEILTPTNYDVYGAADHDYPPTVAQSSRRSFSSVDPGKRQPTNNERDRTNPLQK